MPRRERPGLGAALRDWEATIASAALVVVFGAVVWGVIARYISPRPAVWSGEVAAIGFAWVVFLGAAAGARRGLHIGVDLVTDLLPMTVQRIVAAIVSAVLAVALAYISWLAVVMGIASWTRPTPVLRMPLSVVHVAVFLGFASMAVDSARRAYRQFQQGD